jgi:hypothetical protein
MRAKYGNTAEPRNPRTRSEWQNAVNWAELYLLVDSAKQYGLVTGGPEINTGRCDEILKRGRRRGFIPASTTWLVDNLLPALLSLDDVVPYIANPALVDPS